MLHYDPAVDTKSLYIHWPFCPYKCHFCPFVAYAGHDQFMEPYHKALVAEIKQFQKQIGRKIELETLYFGGGTPSTYPDDLLLDLFAILRESFVISKSTEVTIEVNPGVVRPEQLVLWKRLGVNRLSIGVQALKDSVLHSLNRLQKAQEVFDVLREASPHFDNLSVDLILGLPGISPKEWKDTLAQVVTWPIRHVSLYFLTVHEDTPLYFRMQRGDFVLPRDEKIISLYHWSRTYFEEHEFAQYEISSFARAGYKSRHNTVYWDRRPYRGFGVGACSFDGFSRTRNERDLRGYIKSMDAGDNVVAFVEK